MHDSMVVVGSNQSSPALATYWQLLLSFEDEDEGLIRSFVEYIRLRPSLDQMIIDVHAVLVRQMRGDDLEVENEVAAKARRIDAQF